MRRYLGVVPSLLLSVALGLGGWSASQSSRADEVFIGDGGDNSVKAFDASSGTYLGAFIPSMTAGLDGPRGMIFTDGKLVVVNQNVNAIGNLSGEVLRFDGRTGTFVDKLVASSDRNAPFAPRGIVRGGPNNSYYVADVGTRNGQCGSQASQGDVKIYDAAGAFLGNLNTHGFKAAFYPRGVVFGPDGLLYVSARGCPVSSDPNDALIGYVLRFDPRTNAFVDVFASDATITDLHRPEGLVFDSYGNLWVTSFRATVNDSDKILVLNGKTGALRTKLPLSTPGTTPRAFAQAIIFGPEGNLYVPINGGDPTTTGQLRRYNPKTNVWDVLVPANAAGGALGSGWYIIFRNNDPATLIYRDED